MGHTIGSVAHYLGHQITDPITLSANPFDTDNWRREAHDATNTDPGDIVRNVAGDGAANTLHGVVDTVAPAILSAFLSPAAGAAFTAASNYGNGGSLGSSLGKGALSLGESYAGNAIGGLAGGGGSSSFSPSSLFGSGSSGTFGGGAKDFGNLFRSAPAAISSLASSSPSYGDITNSSIDNLGSNIGSNIGSDTAFNGLANAGSNVGTFGSDLGSGASTIAPAASGSSGFDFGNLASTGGNKVAGNIGLGRALAGAAGGIGQGLAINQAEQDQLKAIKGQQQNLTTFDPSGIINDPGYQFQYDQGLQGLQRQLAAGGGSQSGAALKAAQQYGQNYAQNAFNDYYNRWAAQTGANNQLLGNKGNVQSNALLNQGQNLSSSLNNIFNPSQGGSLSDILKKIAGQ